MPLGYIYEIFDKRTGECIYVGSTSNHPTLRWAQHIMRVFLPAKTSIISTYLRDQDIVNFDLRVLEDCFWKDKIDLRKREQLYMDQRKPRCNVVAAYTTPREKQIKCNARRVRWSSKQTVCVCGAKMTQGHLHHHLMTAKHARRMQEIALATLKDGIRLLPRPVESPIGPELPCPASPERAARVEAQAEAVDGSGEVPRACPNTAAADSTTG